MRRSVARAPSRPRRVHARARDLPGAGVRCGAESGRPTLHRLNRSEYANSVRDLLALEIDGRSLPADDTDAHGFDNNADVSDGSPVLAARYLSAARKIGRLAVGRSTATTIETYRLPRELVQDERLNERLPFGSRGGTVVDHYFPADGEYIVKIRLQTNNYNYIKGLADLHDLEVRLDRRRVKVFASAARKKELLPRAGAEPSTAIPNGRSTRCRCTTISRCDCPSPRASTNRHRVYPQVGESEDVVQPRQGGWPLSSDETVNSKSGVDRSSSKGRTSRPAPETPRRAAGSSRASRAAGDVATGLCADDSVGDRPSRLSPALSDRDVQTVMEFYNRGRRDGGFDGGIQHGLERILVSPDSCSGSK